MLRSLRIASLLVAGLSASTARAQIQMYEYEGVLSSNLGWAVSPVGDVDADGYEDFAVGSPKYGTGIGTPHFAGRVTIQSGRTGDLIRTYIGQNAGDYFGYAIDGIGDFDLDGFDDYVIGAPFTDGLGLTDNGAVWLFSGKGGSAVGVHHGAHDGDTIGTSVSGVGDVTGDGRPDYAYGASNADTYILGFPSAIDAGLVYVRSSATQSIVWAWSSSEPYSYSGASIDEIGDLTADGISELIVGVPYADNLALGADTGKVWVLSGADGSKVYEISGAWGGGHFGLSVAGLGDVNGGSLPDFIVGAPTADSNGVDSGEVRVFSGLSGSSMWVHNGVSGSQAGTAVASMGDVDSDGHADFAYGMPKADLLGAIDVGMVRVCSGKTGLITNVLVGPSGSQFGNAVAGFDVNKDGHTDLLAGAAAHTTTSAGAGLARLILLGVQAPKPYCTAKVNSAGCTPKISYSGAPSLLSGPGFTVRASKILKNMPGLMIWSTTSNAVPFGGGTLCLGGSVKRTSGQTSGPGVLGFPCTSSFQYDIGLAFTFLNGLSAGDTIYTQFWSRDTGFAAPNNMNLTDGLEVTFVL